MRLIGCPFCQGVPSLPPCRGFCLNVAQGCLSTQALDPDWGAYLGEGILTSWGGFFYTGGACGHLGWGTLN